MRAMLETEFYPAAQKDSKRLLIALHGLGDSTAGYRWMPSALRLPWLNYLLVNAPDDYYGGYSWYDFAGNPGPGIERSRKLLFGLLDAQRANGFPTEETILFGFSQGCLMTVDVGFRYPHRFAGLVGVSGYVHEPARLLQELSPVAKEQRMLFTHGTQDPLIPCAEVRKQVDGLKAAGLNITWREFAKVHTIAGDEELDVIRDFVSGGFSR
ncbi:MAG: serine esterase [Verrucomicrobia bacterium]|nr:serine esterase [Verrucomicrobiota bacterium]